MMREHGRTSTRTVPLPNDIDDDAGGRDAVRQEEVLPAGGRCCHPRLDETADDDSDHGRSSEARTRHICRR